MVFFNSGQQIHVQLGVVMGGVCQSKNIPGAFVRLEDQSIWDFIQLYAFGKNVIGYDDLKIQIESLKSMKVQMDSLMSMKNPIELISEKLNGIETCQNNNVSGINIQNDDEYSSVAFQDNFNYTEVEIKVEITTEGIIVEKDDVILFENKIQDEHNNFNVNRGIFEAPWDGNFTFISNGFKDANDHPRLIHGTIFKITPERFPISPGTGTTKNH